MIPSPETNSEEQELYEHYKIFVDPGQSLVRLDKFLSAKIANASRTRVQTATDEGYVLVNGKASKSSYKVKPLDEISVVLPRPPVDTTLQPENIPLNIIYEDEEVLVLDKPPGMVVHPGHGNYNGTLANALLYHFNNLPTSRNGEMRPGLVHRIDKDTSGLMVIAKSERAMISLAKQFFDHTVKRSYRALVWGDLDGEGTITGNIGRSLKDRTQMAVFQDEEHGKHAVTHYKVLERFHYVTLVECNLETGRTHQIRVHMKHIGHTLFNDTTYGGDKIMKGTTFNKYRQFVDNCFELMPRQALHAATLGFVHPVTKEEVFFESPLPADFSAVLEKWRNLTKFL